MILLPAIELKDGQCVRRRKREAHTSQPAVFGPWETVCQFREAGARWLHLVDLDGTHGGLRKNFPIIDRVIRESGLRVELGGGIRTEPDLITAVGAGAARAVIGSAASPALLDYALRWCPAQAAVEIVSLNGWVHIPGRDGGIPLLEFAQEIAGKGVTDIIVTDVVAQGLPGGPAYAALERLVLALPQCRVIAGDGIATPDDVKRLRDMGLYGAILGRGYYAGTVDLAEAVRVAGPQDDPGERKTP